MNIVRLVTLVIFSVCLPIFSLADRAGKAVNPHVVHGETGVQDSFLLGCVTLIEEGLDHTSELTRSIGDPAAGYCVNIVR